MIETGTVDITTTGRKTGQVRRIEIYISNLDGEFYISGKPGQRGWYANLLSDPALTIHLKNTTGVAIDAQAEPITAADAKRSVLRRIMIESYDMDPEKADADLDRWVEASPLVQVQPV